MAGQRTWGIEYVLMARGASEKIDHAPALKLPEPSNRQINLSLISRLPGYPQYLCDSVEITQRGLKQVAFVLRNRSSNT